MVPCFSFHDKKNSYNYNVMADHMNHDNEHYYGVD